MEHQRRQALTYPQRPLLSWCFTPRARGVLRMLTLHSLAAQGTFIYAVARTLGLARNTVRKYLCRGRAPPHRATAVKTAVSGDQRRHDSGDPAYSQRPARAFSANPRHAGGAVQLERCCDLAVDARARGWFRRSRSSSMSV
jgi:hypothetical protein